MNESERATQANSTHGNPKKTGSAD